MADSIKVTLFGREWELHRMTRTTPGAVADYLSSDHLTCYLTATVWPNGTDIHLCREAGEIIASGSGADVESAAAALRTDVDDLAQLLGCA